MSIGEGMTDGQQLAAYLERKMQKLLLNSEYNVTFHEGKLDLTLPDHARKDGNDNLQDFAFRLLPNIFPRNEVTLSYDENAPADTRFYLNCQPAVALNTLQKIDPGYKTTLARWEQSR